jgi:hypothetical protein
MAKKKSTDPSIKLREQSRILGEEMRKILKQGKPAYMFSPLTLEEDCYKVFEMEGERVKIRYLVVSQRCSKCGCTVGNVRTPPHWSDGEEDSVNYLDNMHGALENYFDFLGNEARENSVISGREEVIFQDHGVIGMFHYSPQEMLERYLQESEELEKRFARHKRQLIDLMKRLAR